MFNLIFGLNKLLSESKIGSKTVKLKLPYIQSQKNKRKTVRSPYIDLFKILRDEGFIRSFKVSIQSQSQQPIYIIDINLKYNKEGKAAITKINSVSTPGRKVEVDTRTLWQANHAAGLSVLTTSRGIYTDSQARQTNVGGYVLFNIY